MNFNVKIRIFYWSIFILILAVILYLGVIPGGHVSYKTDFKDNNYFFGIPTPAERIVPADSGYSMIGDPIYFSLYTPRKFDIAKLTIRYKDESASPLIEAGVMSDKLVWNYDLRPVQNKILDNLRSKWDVIDSHGLTLFQRNNKYGSIENFLMDLPPLDEVALYNYNLRFDFQIYDYEPAGAVNEINIPLRGPYQFYTYIKDEKLYFKYSFYDLNKKEGADQVDINLYKNGNFIATRHLPDDGTATDNGDQSAARILDFSIDGLSEGAYKIELKCSSDIVTQKIETRQNRLSFVNKIWIAEGTLEDLKVYSDSRVVTLETSNPARLQTAVIGRQKLAVNETFKQFGVRTKEKINEIKLKKDDVALSGDGMFSFAASSLFNPTIKKMNENSDVDKDGINYILGEYESPAQDNGWKISVTEFNINPAYRENGKYFFLISAPRLGTPNNPGSILIDEVKVDLYGKNIFEYFKKFFSF